MPSKPSRRPASKPRRSMSSAANGPRQTKSNIEIRHQYRFTSTSGTFTGITPTSLLCAMGTMGTAVNTSVQSFFASCKVNQIEIWSPPASQGSSVTCSVNFAGYANAPNREYSDTSVSVSTPAHLVCSPPPQSLASFWQTAGTNTVFQISAPTGSIIDIWVFGILQDSDDTYAFTLVAAAVVGNVYYLSLDPNATHRYVPVALTTTT
jgi:hypothetical protein